VPTFCRHNRLAQNCPICRNREAEKPAARRRTAAPKPARTVAGTRARRPGAASDLKVRRVHRAADDGYRHDLVPGLRATADAERLAEAMGASAGRLRILRAAPPGLYAEVAGGADAEEALWLAFLIAYLGPLESPDPFAGVAAARVPWAGGEAPALDGAPLGPRTSHATARGLETVAAYRAFAQRAGSQAAALGGEPAWSPSRRFARGYERLALPGLTRAARYDLMLTLGALGRLDCRPETLMLTGAGDETALAAKRVFGIADPMLLERRAADLAAAAQVPVGALDLALWSWGGAGDWPLRAGVEPGSEDDGARGRARAALDVDE
jgi:hypothetical protein